MPIAVSMVRMVRPCAFTLGLALAAALTGAEADLILHNGKIVTVDKQFSIRQAVAIKNGRITAVGDSSSVLRAHRGPKTQVMARQRYRRSLIQ